MKRTSTLILSVILGLAVCTYAVAGEKKIRVGVSYYSLSAEFLAQLRDSMDEHYRDQNLGDTVELIVLDAQGDANKQNDQVYNLISQGVDAIIIDPYDREQQVPAVEACAEAGIPCIEMNASTVSPQRTSYVGSDDIVSGRLLARELLRLSGGKGNIIVIHGVAGQNSEVMRHAGLEEVLRDFPGAKVVAEKVCDWDRAKALAAVENFIQSGLEFDIIFGENDEMALGALVALENSGRREGVFVGGVDAIPDALEAVKDGRLDCTVFQNSAAQARKALDVAIEAAQGKSIDAVYDIPYELVTPANIGEYVK
ncbi:MAG: substrate-binding domain-containing protein [Planctomycetaceae bacterium]|nr:substrate-binding domain-containing protein [Planctomycetaceae bacterium]